MNKSSLLFSALLFLATLGVVAPLLLGLKLTMTRLGRRPVWIARVATAVAFVLPSLLWQSWLDGPSPIPLIHVGLSLGAAGVVMASAVFPVPRTA